MRVAVDVVDTGPPSHLVEEMDIVEQASCMAVRLYVPTHGSMPDILDIVQLALPKQAADTIAKVSEASQDGLAVKPLR